MQMSLVQRSTYDQMNARQQQKQCALSLNGDDLLRPRANKNSEICIDAWAKSVVSCVKVRKECARSND